MRRTPNATRGRPQWNEIPQGKQAAHATQAQRSLACLPFHALHFPWHPVCQNPTTDRPCICLLPKDRQAFAREMHFSCRDPSSERLSKFRNHTSFRGSSSATLRRTPSAKRGRPQWNKIPQGRQAAHATQAQRFLSCLPFHALYFPWHPVCQNPTTDRPSREKCFFVPSSELRVRRSALSLQRRARHHRSSRRIPGSGPRLSGSLAQGSRGA